MGLSVGGADLAYGLVFESKLDSTRASCESRTKRFPDSGEPGGKLARAGLEPGWSLLAAESFSRQVNLNQQMSVLDGVDDFQIS